MSKTLEISDETYEKIKDQLLEEEAIEVNSMEELVGNKFAFQCARYIYFGKVKKVNSVFIELGDAQTVFETCEYSNTSASDAQDMPKGKLFLKRQSIEAIYPKKW